ncbi:MAG: hydantoinase/oxoprolinase family protein [Pseudomonadota bacterium]
MNRFVGVDIGGTNTDLIFVDVEARVLRVAKVPTTAHDQAEGLIAGIDALDIRAGEIDLIIHGTTVATNAAIERKGAICGLVTTEGFRDVLELRRRDRPHTYGLGGTFAPLIPRHLRREVPERVSAEGEVLVPLDEEAVRRQIIELRDAGCESLAICFLHSYANPTHEQIARDIALELWPNDYVAISSEVLPTMREFERTSATAVTAYVQPLIGRYLESLSHKLKEQSYERELLVVQSNGGVMSAPLATRFAANTILSGPAGGVTAASAIARDLALTDVVSCDMGGTSLDICVIRDGIAAITLKKAVDFGVPLALPMMDVDAIGAGGGSIARIDGAGILQVGPESAGANPGPACYGRGGKLATVTDASVVLGLLNPDAAIGKGRGSGMDLQLASAAIGDTLAQALGLSVEDAAEAILTITGSKMAGHVRRKLLERGLDPRKFSMIAFGGAGPVHANRILREVGLARAVIPYFPGITSALGCILGQLRHDFLWTVNRTLSSLTDQQVAQVFENQSSKGRAYLAQEGSATAAIHCSFSAEMCYRGQSNLVAVEFEETATPTLDSIRRAFKRTYQELYGELLDSDTDIILGNARTVVSSPSHLNTIAPLIKLPTGKPPEPTHARVYFSGKWLDANRYERLKLPAGAVIRGPALLMQQDTTCFVEPGYCATVHATGNIFIESE